jgi:hypothetical protein
VAIDSVGNLYVSDGSNYTIRKISTGGTVSTVAGTAGVQGTLDGNGSGAQFTMPEGLAVDGSGNIYVADVQAGTIRKISAQGVVTTLAGSAGMPGSTDGMGSAAQFNRPWGVAVDPAGNLYVADSGNNVIRKITSGGLVTTVAGLAGFAGDVDGAGTNARLNGPVGVAIDSSGNLFVSETSNTLRMVTPAGVVSTIAGAAGVAGSSNGNGSLARFNFPASLAVDGNENLFVADSLNSTVRFGAFISLPVISAQSPNQSAASGSGVTISVTATASPAIGYQWLFNGNLVPGATSSSLIIPSLLGLPRKTGHQFRRL